MSLQVELEQISSRVTIQDGVYQQLRNALIVGRFDPGQVLTISSLATSFGTSHMPVREALRRLAAENALEIAHNGSARVPAVTLGRLDDLCRARTAIEGLTTEIAAGKVTADDIAKLEDIEEQHEAAARAGNVYDMLDKNREFHFCIYRASGSEVLTQLIDTLWLRFGPYMRMLSTNVMPILKSGIYGPYTERHHAMIAAFKGRETSRAREEMVADIRTTQDLLRTLIEA